VTRSHCFGPERSGSKNADKSVSNAGQINLLASLDTIWASVETMRAAKKGGIARPTFPYQARSRRHGGFREVLR
jgi:hypothetical protein